MIRRGDQAGGDSVIVRLSSLGDIAQDLAVAATLERRGHRLAWLVEDRFAELLEFFDGELEVWSWRRGLRGALALRNKARTWHRALDVQGNTKSAFLAACIGAEEVIGLAPADLREFGSRLFRQRRAASAAGPHVLDRAARVLSLALGEELSAQDLARPPFLRPSEASTRELSERLCREGLEAMRLAVVVGHPADPRSWPVEAAAKLVMRRPAERFLLLGPRERDLVVPADVPKLQQEGGVGELITLAALLAERGGAAVGHDGGAMHVMRAAGLATCFLFGPQDPRRTGPFDEPVLQADTELDCRPCRLRHCPRPDGAVCMQRITVDEVEAMASRMLA